MNTRDELYQTLLSEQKQIAANLDILNDLLEITEDLQKSIVIKRINGKLYYYIQWRESGKVRTEYLSPVLPGAAAKEEKEIMERQELLEEKKEVLLLQKHVERMIGELKKEQDRQKILKDYTFEVFWKDEITAKVHAKGSQVRVSRYVLHPVKQLFSSDNISRNQLNEVLEQRCPDRNRPDTMEILSRKGIEEYNPYEIVKKTHGVSYNDYCWFRFPGEKITGKDVLVR